MRLWNTHVFAVLLAAPFATTGYAQAAPELSVLATGGCPTQSELEHCLTERDLRLGNSDYLVTTQRESDDVVMQLVRNGNEVLLTRHFSSGDCRAVAEATAVVVEAYFIEVRGWSPGSEALEQTQEQTRTASTAPASPRPAQASAAPATPAPSDRVSARPLTLPVARTRSESQLSRARPAALGAMQDDAHGRESSPAARGTFFAGIGPTMAFPEVGPSVQFEAGGGIELERMPLSVEMQLATSLPNVSGGEPNRVRRWPSQAVIRLGVPWGSTFRYRPWVGFGAGLAEVRALDVPGASSRSTLTALVGAGVELAWPIARGWLGRFDASCTALTTRDAYRLDAEGEIGRGPRVVCGAAVGVRSGSGSAAKKK